MTYQLSETEINNVEMSCPNCRLKVGFSVEIPSLTYMKFLKQTNELLDYELSKLREILDTIKGGE